MKIAIMSDCHDNWNNLEKAVSIANDEACDLLLFAGDLISPTGVAILANFKNQVAIVWGNNEGEKLGIFNTCGKYQNIKLAGDIFETELENCKIFMHHQPRIVELAAKSQEFDFCVYGHTHEYFSDTIGKTKIINPGNIHGLHVSAGFAIFDTVNQTVKHIETL